tara:strand:- start:456 stop:659 length:204 start_codon:yes stop_codon:yes gene_type:complete
MNKDIIEGNWEQLKGSAQKKWGKLTNDSFDEIEGSRKKLAGKIQEAYGKSKDEAEKEISEWEKTNAA